MQRVQEERYAVFDGDRSMFARSLVFVSACREIQSSACPTARCDRSQ